LPPSYPRVARPARLTRRIPRSRLFELYAAWAKAQGYQGILTRTNFAARAADPHTVKDHDGNEVDLNYFRTKEEGGLLMHDKKKGLCVDGVDLTEEGHTINERGFAPIIDFASL
jgi:hypothetical protein